LPRNYRPFFWLLTLLALVPLNAIPAQSESNPQVNVPKAIVRHIPASFDVILSEDGTWSTDTVVLYINGMPEVCPVVSGRTSVSRTFDKQGVLTISRGDWEFHRTIHPIPLWMSVIPPLIAIVFALALREVFSALFTGLLFGAVIIAYYQGHSFFSAVFIGFLDIADTYIIESLNNPDHLSIIVFSMLIGATVTLISYNGGMRGVVSFLARYARSPRSGQFVTWLLGIMIFFDDYANTLIVGNTMRPVTDRLRISREKLSYIVDSTAAPIAAIAFVTTWIGAELSYIQDGINVIGLETSAYDVFINSLVYSFYPFLALAFIALVVLTRRDFGPMLKAERKARQGIIDKIHPGISEDETVKQAPEKERWYNAVIPVVIIVAVTVTGLITSGLRSAGWDPSLGFAGNLSHVIGQSNSYQALLWGSLSGAVAAVILTVAQRILSLKESMESLLKGFKTMVTAVLILVLAWSIALITKYMHTADFISGLLLEINLTPYVIPSITFLLAAFVAFATGSSWGTMAILYPLILPASWLLSQESGLNHDQSMAIFYNVVSTVLAGSVLGDHCSPISDTTILSSLASSCNHIEHVRTQLPYALVVGGVATLFGTLPAAYGVPSGLLLLVDIGLLYLIIRFFGRKTAFSVVSNKA
jgi:Na+/H+ antiporter NhaC